MSLICWFFQTFNLSTTTNNRLQYFAGGHAYPLQPVLENALRQELEPITPAVPLASARYPQTTVTAQALVIWGDGVTVTGHEMYEGTARIVAKRDDTNYECCTLPSG